MENSAGQDKKLRGHTGRHSINMTNFVGDENFPILNRALREVRDDKDILIVNFCHHGRHRSVANKEVQFALFTNKWFNGQRRMIGMIDLQSARHWGRPCSKHCRDCDMTHSDFAEAIPEGVSGIRAATEGSTNTEGKPELAEGNNQIRNQRRRTFSPRCHSIGR